MGVGFHCMHFAVQTFAKSLARSTPQLHWDAHKLIICLKKLRESSVARDSRNLLTADRILVLYSVTH